jgi:hypothetical protein
MQKIVLPAAAAVLLALGAAQGFAQGAPKAPTKAPAPRSAASMECSRQADAKNLHGAPRKQFRSKCMRSMAKSKTPTQNSLGYR